jgi:hypothetical protein
MHRTRTLLVAAALVASMGVPVFLAAQEPAAVPVPVDQAPPALQPAVEKAQAAAKALQSQMQTRLVELLPKNGPAGALDVCRKEAYVIAAEIGMQHGVAIGRTSHKLRNPKNAPKPWAAPVVAQYAGKKFVDAKPYVADLGTQVGLLQPVAMGEACSMCHGNASWQPDDVAAVLKQNYPGDQATGFTTGDVRGWIWVEVPKK